MPIGDFNRNLKDAKLSNVEHTRLDRSQQRKRLDLLQSLNRDLAKDQPESRSEIDGVIESFELGFRMQSALPAVMDISGESPRTLESYGIGGGGTDAFGRQCLLARRMAESGVRFIQLTDDNWDHHGGLAANMPKAAHRIDKPIAGLITDLKQRGLFDDTLIVWGGEFGRTPDDGTRDGRGHNADGFTMWLAGGGVKSGFKYGATDEYGRKAIDGKVHIHDLHATMLHLLGLDHEALTYPWAGRDFRLTDVHGAGRERNSGVERNFIFRCNQANLRAVDVMKMKRKWLLTLSVFAVAGLANSAEEGWKLTDADRARIETEIEAFGLYEAPRISDAKTGAKLSADTKTVVIDGGGKDVLESIEHLEIPLPRYRGDHRSGS